MTADVARLDWWPVEDSRSGRTVAWAYDADERRAYVIFRGDEDFRPYVYADIDPETAESVQRSDYVSKAIAHQIKGRGSYTPLPRIDRLPYVPMNPEAL